MGKYDIARALELIHSREGLERVKLANFKEEMMIDLLGEVIMRYLDLGSAMAYHLIHSTPIATILSKFACTSKDDSYY
jgi:hypothetical protein